MYARDVGPRASRLAPLLGVWGLRIALVAATHVECATNVSVCILPVARILVQLPVTVYIITFTIQHPLLHVLRTHICFNLTTVVAEKSYTGVGMK